MRSRHREPHPWALLRCNHEDANDPARPGPPCTLPDSSSCCGADATAITNLLLPDLLIFQIGNPDGFGTFVTSGTGQGGFFAGTVLGNGRRLRDEAIDAELNVLTNGAITTDNVSDDNGTRITDGNLGTTAAFPYIGPANLPLNGPGTGPNP